MLIDLDLDLSGAFDELLDALTGAHAHVTVVPTEAGKRDFSDVVQAAKVSGDHNGNVDGSV